MEFTIAREELQGALYLMQGVLERHTPIPIRSNVLFTADADGVVIAATDQQVGVHQRCVCKVKKKGAATANGRMLYEIVRELPDGPVTLRLLENQWVEIGSGKSKFKVVGIDPQEFPAMPRMGREGEKLAFKVPCGALADMIEHTLIAVSPDETRANLNGIFVERPQAGQLRLVATDGHRLSMVTRPVEGVAEGGGVILPRKGVVEIKRLIDGDGDDAVSLETKGNVIHAARGKVEISMRLVEGEFPDYRQVIPSGLSRRVVVEVGPLAAALRRVAILSSDVSHGVRVAVEVGRVRVSSVNPDRGEAEDEIEAEIDGEPISVGFNVRYLLDVLSVMNPEGRVEISLGDELSPGTIQIDDDPSFLYVVMPMRL